MIGPSHRGRFNGLAMPDATHFQTPLGDIPLDVDALAVLGQSPHFVVDAGAHAQEHCIEMQLPLLQRALPAGWRLIPLLTGSMTPETYAEAARALRPWLDAETLLVLSGDFTHYGPNYGYTPFPPDAEAAARLRALDTGAVEFVQARDAAGLHAYHQRTGITACALGPLYMLLPLLPEDAQTHWLQYTTSGGLTGDYTHSVSYLALAFSAPKPLADEDSGSGYTALGLELLQCLHDLAADALVAAVRNDAAAGAQIQARAATLPAALARPAGAFVTLKKHGELRGCIGYIQPHAPLFQAVIDNATSAALRDPRFHPVAPAELAELTLEISVLTPPRAISSATEFMPGQHGIILHKDGRRAVFLPEVATEQGWNREQTLEHLARKAGLPASAWRGASFEIFTTQSYTRPLTR